MFTAGVLYLLINSLVFTASPEGMNVSYASFGLFGVWFLICIFFWFKWRLMRDPKVGVKYDSDLLEHKEGLDPKVLSEMYRHPLETTYPSPAPRHRD